MDDELMPSSDGLLRCLQALTEESAALGLTRTLLSLQQTISICFAESRMTLSATTVACAGLIH